MNKKLSLFLLLISIGLLTALAAGPVFAGNHQAQMADDHAQTAGGLRNPRIVGCNDATKRGIRGGCKANLRAPWLI